MKLDRTTRDPSTVVIALLRNYSLNSLGVHILSVCITVSRLDIYRLYNAATTLCARCSQLSHSASGCSSTPSYDYCGADHPTYKYVYAAHLYSAGTRCTHPPVKFINCNNDNHASTDPAGSAKVRTREHARRLNMLMETEEAPL